MASPVAAKLVGPAAALANSKPCEALSTVKYLLSMGWDCNLGVWSDSTGNENGDGVTTLREWPYSLAYLFAAAYPTYKVQVYQWDYTTSTTSYYSTPTVIAAGSGGPTLTIYNFSVPSAPTMYGLGSLFQAALVAPALDALLLAHGHNHTYTTANTDPVVRGELVAAIEQFKLYKPGVPIDLVLQNPNRDDNNMAKVYDAWRKVAQYRDVGLIDVYAAFIAAGKPASWYQSTGNTTNDNVHPGQIGSDAHRDVIWAAFQAATTRPATPRSSLLLPAPADANLLTNGNFAQWTTSPGAPDGWTAGGAGSVTVTKDTAVYPDNKQPYSAKLLGTGGATYIIQNLSGTLRARLFGQAVTLAVRLYMPNTSVATVGKVQVNVVAASLSGGAATYGTRGFVTRADGWVWQVISGIPIPRDATGVSVLLYHDTAASPSANPVYFDQAWLTAGYLPGGAR